VGGDLQKARRSGCGRAHRWGRSGRRLTTCAPSNTPTTPSRAWWNTRYIRVYTWTRQDGDLLRHYLYTYDLAGNRLSASVAVNGGTPTVTSYSYNAAQPESTTRALPTMPTEPDPATTPTPTTWDRANRLTSMGGLTYTYDGAGNRISLEQRGGCDPVPVGPCSPACR